MPQTWSAFVDRDRHPARRIVADSVRQEPAGPTTLARVTGTVGIVAALVIDLSVTLLAFALGAAFSLFLG